MSKELDIPALLALCENCMPGPWESAPTPEYKLLAEGYHFPTPFEVSDKQSTVAVVTKYGGLEKAHAEFIAAARIALPAALARIQKLEKQISRMAQGH